MCGLNVTICYIRGHLVRRDLLNIAQLGLLHVESGLFQSNFRSFLCFMFTQCCLCVSDLPSWDLFHNKYEWNGSSCGMRYITELCMNSPRFPALNHFWAYSDSVPFQLRKDQQWAYYRCVKDWEISHSHTHKYIHFSLSGSFIWLPGNFESSRESHVLVFFHKPPQITILLLLYFLSFLSSFFLSFFFLSFLFQDHFSGPLRLFFALTCQLISRNAQIILKYI